MSHYICVCVYIYLCIIVESNFSTEKKAMLMNLDDDGMGMEWTKLPAIFEFGVVQLLTFWS